MEVHKAFVDLKLWKGVGGDIEREVASAKKRVTVVVPWISKKYVEMLAKKAEEIGKDNVELVMVEDENNYKSLRDVVKRKVDPPNFVFNFVLFIVSVIGAFFGIYGFLTRYNVLFLVLFALMSLPLFVFYREMRSSFVVEEPFKITIQRKGGEYHIHSKIYLIDDRMYLTSANMTHTGFWKNIEMLVKIKDPQAIEEIERFIEGVKGKIESISLEEFMKVYGVKYNFLGF